MASIEARPGPSLPLPHLECFSLFIPPVFWSDYDNIKHSSLTPAWPLVHYTAFRGESANVNCRAAS